MTKAQLIADLKKLADPIKANQEQRFFKTGPGEYAAGDKFIGVSVPRQRKLAKKYCYLPLVEVWKLLSSPIHEHRLTALFMLVHQYRAGDNKTKKNIVSGYLQRSKYVNNWDLVDSSAQHILGDYLVNKPRQILAKLANSKLLWDRRVAIISTLTLIRHGQYDDTLRLAVRLLKDKHDLMHKATGWMLREVGNRDVFTLKKFLDKYASQMPRTMLRYAIEKFPPTERSKYLAKKPRLV